MIITIHDNVQQWKHAKPLQSLIDHLVVVFVGEDKDTVSEVYDGVVMALTDNNELLLDEGIGENPILIPLTDVYRIHYL